MAITTTEQTSILNLVVSMFNAAPGAANLTSIVAYYEANGKSLTTLANALASSTAFTDQFAGLVTNEGVATKMAANFGLTIGTAYTNAYNYFVGELAAGKTKAAIMLAANNYLTSTTYDPMFADAAATLTNKTTVAYDYSVTKQLSGATMTALQAAVSGVDATAASVTTKIAAATTGTTQSLTAAADTLTGTTGNDTFIGDNTGTDTSSTADTIDGGNGTDTLKIYSDGAAGALPALTSVETVTVYDQDADFNMAAASWASVTTVNAIRNDGDVGLTVGANVTTVNLEDIALDDAGANDGVTITAAAAATALTVGLNGVTVGTSASDEDVNLVGAGLTTVTINTSGTASSFEQLDVAAATAITLNAGVALTVTGLETTGTAALTITGAGAVDLGTLDADINTITATTATGALTAAIGAAVDTVITLGSGNDVITASTTDAIVTADTLAVNAGTGTGDVLVIAATADIDTAADAARYTNFETIRTADSVNMALVAGITALQITGGTSETYSNMSATQAANVTFRADNTTSTIFSLATATGSADALVLNLASTTATTDVDVIGISAVDFETVTFNATTGTNTTDDTAIGFLANSADSVSRVNITGTSDVTLTVAANTLDVVAVTIDASTMTGTADFTLVQTSDLVTGSTVTGTLNADTIALGTTLGSTYNGGAGNDTFTGAFAVLVADGTGDTIVNGGTGTDILSLSNTTVTLTDNHFTNVSSMETLTLSSTVGSIAMTTGAEFDSAFANGATITTGILAATTEIVLNAGTSNVAINLTVDATSLTGAVTETNSIITGSGADTVTFTADGDYVGVAGATGTVVISAGAGADTISVTYGNLLANTTSQAFTITGGTGVDSITKVGTNGAGATAFASFVVAAGDSTTTAYDTITGFDVGDTTNYSDGLDFSGTGAVGTLATSLDSGTILTHSITAGVALFDDAASYNAAIVINATNLADVISYLALNTATNGVVAFAYDSDASGTADATMVYHNGTTDSLVLLAGVTGVDAVVNAAGTGANDLFIA